MFTIGEDEDGAEKDPQAAQVAALLRERDGYVARGLSDRVDAVEAALVAAGVEVVERATPPEPTTERATKRKR